MTFFHSIRWRLQAWHGLILLVVIAALCGAVYRLAALNEFARIDRDLQQHERALIRGLLEATRPADDQGGPGSPKVLLERLSARAVAIPADLLARFSGDEPGHHYFIIRDAAGRDLLRSPNAPADRVLLAPGANEFTEDNRTLDDTRESLRASRDGIASLVGRDITAEREQLRRFAWSLAATGLGLWLLGLFGGWWLAGRALRPVAAISRAATRIAEGDLAERIDVAATDGELDQLGRVLNQTFDRLRESFERQRRFTADAAHELRTPVSILLAETQRILKRDRSPEEYRDALRTCGETAGRMRRLVEALLLLARFENNAAPPSAPCDLAALAADAARHLAPLADERRVRLHLELQPARCSGDPDALGILLSNLLANAIQHHRPEGGQVWISTHDEGGRAVLIVRDDGPGIPEEHLPHIFERFHRADAARTGGSGHSGLGLAIARTIAETHRGAIHAANRPPAAGATFTLTLPAAA